MKRHNKLHNTLINRELLPPPFDFRHVSNITSLRLATPALLHQAISSCGGAFLCASFNGVKLNQS